MSRYTLSVILAIVLVCAFFLGADAQVSGSSRLDLAAFPIPCSLVSEIKLDTPCEQTILKFDIESLSSFALVLSGMTMKVNTAIGIAGPEHAIFTLDARLGAMDLQSEIWFATPFETVVDVNNAANVVVIPPGNILFVKKRDTVKINIGGVLISNLAMFEDITFPQPGAAYRSNCDNNLATGDPQGREGTCVVLNDGTLVVTNPASSYQTQSWGFGDILTLTGQTVSGISISGTVGFCAEQGSNSVKKFSAPGRVSQACVAQRFAAGDVAKSLLQFGFETLSVSGIKLGDLSVSTSLQFRPDKPFASTTSTSFRVGDFASVSLSLQVDSLLKITAAENVTGTIKVDASPLQLRVSLDPTFQLKSGGASFRQTFDLGNTVTTVSGSASMGAGTGLNSLVLGVNLTQGSNSANQTVSFIRDPIKGGLTFGSLSIRMNARLAPYVVTLTATFGKVGLARFALTSGIVF